MLNEKGSKTSEEQHDYEPMYTLDGRNRLPSTWAFARTILATWGSLAAVVLATDHYLPSEERDFSEETEDFSLDNGIDELLPILSEEKGEGDKKSEPEDKKPEITALEVETIEVKSQSATSHVGKKARKYSGALADIMAGRGSVPGKMKVAQSGKGSDLKIGESVQAFPFQNNRPFTPSQTMRRTRGSLLQVFKGK